MVVTMKNRQKKNTTKKGQGLVINAVWAQRVKEQSDK